MISCCFYCCFFFKQKTAYEMRISDWSSDVCSSDLAAPVDPRRQLSVEPHRRGGRPRLLRAARRLGEGEQGLGPQRPRLFGTLLRRQSDPLDPAGARRQGCRGRVYLRSEEHTSELQSLMRISYAVFCLKKKKHRKQ